MVEGQLRDSTREYSDFFFTQREPEYDQDTDLHQRESMRNEEKKFLDKQCNPMYLQGVRTIMKSDSTGPQGFGQPCRMDLMWVNHIDSPIQPFRDLTEQGAGSSICWCFRLLRSRTGGHQIRQPYSCLHTWMERLCRWPYYCRTKLENVGRT